MGYVYLIWAFEKTLKTYPNMMSNLLCDATCSAGYLSFRYSQCDWTASENVLDPMSIDDLFFDSLSSADDIKALISKRYREPSDFLMLCDSDAPISAALDARIDILLFDPEHLYDNCESKLRADSFAALRELLGI